MLQAHPPRELVPHASWSAPRGTRCRAQRTSAERERSAAVASKHSATWTVLPIQVSGNGPSGATNVAPLRSSEYYRRRADSGLVPFLMPEHGGLPREPWIARVGAKLRHLCAHAFQHLSMR